MKNNKTIIALICLISLIFAILQVFEINTINKYRDDVNSLHGEFEALNNSLNAAHDSIWTLDEKVDEMSKRLGF